MIEHDAAADFQQAQAGTLPQHLGIEWTEVTNGRASGFFVVERHHMAPNRFVHAASVIALVDSAAGYGCVASLPEGASGFTTIELKSNFLSSAKRGERVEARAWLVHGGRMTQVWDAEAVNAATGKTMALFRCTQMILYPK